LDHKWGRQVEEWGLSSAGATLAARFTTGVVAYLTNYINPDTRKIGVWEPPADVLNDAYTYYEIFPLSSLRFPYGWTVLPDGPV